LIRAVTKSSGHQTKGAETAMRAELLYRRTFLVGRLIEDAGEAPGKNLARRLNAASLYFLKMCDLICLSKI
jgi:hypothetical protein